MDFDPTNAVSGMGVLPNAAGLCPRQNGYRPLRRRLLHGVHAL